MKFKLESIKPSLDRDVENKGIQEMKYDNSKYNPDENSKDSYDYLFDNDYNPGEKVFLNDLEGVDDDDYLWTNKDLGKYTINTLTEDKLKAERIFKEIEDLELESNAAIDEQIARMEDEW